MDLQLTAKALFITLLLVGAYVFIAVSLSTLTIYNHGFLTTIGVAAYQDSACTTPLTAIEWPDISPGQIQNVTGFLRNEGNVDIILTLTTSDYQPPIAETYLTASWNYTDTALAPDIVLPIKFSLAAALNTQGFSEYSFNMTIEGIQ